ncbi:MAG: hypothetical protein ACK4FB_08910 [Brevundimonas sp.]|uniref:hypothetical protein n=1 Tax=Brevundimonas sp. TaxID=1871086 RepID=UPI003918F4D9
MIDLYCLVLAEEAELPPDEEFTPRQVAVIDAMWALTGGVGGAWCDSRAVAAAAGRYAWCTVRALIRRGVVEQGAVSGQPRQPHSRHVWPLSLLYRFTQEGFAEVALTQGVLR